MKQETLMQLMILLLDTIPFVLYLLILCRKAPKRSGFGWRLPLLVLGQAVLCVPLALLRAGNDTLGMRVLIEILFSAVQLLALPVLYRGAPKQYLLWFSGVLMTKNFSGNAYQFLLNLFGKDDTQTISFFSDGLIGMRDWIIYAAIQIILLLFIAWLFERGDKERSLLLNPVSVGMLTGVTLLLRCVVQPFIRTLQPNESALLVCVRALMLLVYLLLIAIRSGLMSRKRAETDLEINEQLLQQERKRYTEMRDTIELINMRFHDLKRHLGDLQEKLTDEELTTVSEARALYDGTIRTGSEIVDTVLCQKQIVCTQKGIALSYVCDGTAVRFVEPSKLYSVLDNALENAMEATASLPEEERVISVGIAKQDENIRIEVSNYFDPSVAVTNGTSKADRQRHGYGLKSMRYIAESMGGSVQIEQHGNMYFLTVLLPTE